MNEYGSNILTPEEVKRTTSSQGFSREDLKVVAVWSSKILQAA
jgi:hypothetical protein